MLDLKNEHPISFREAADLVSGGVHRATVSRWASMGIGPENVKLESERIAGRVVTTREALARFLRRCREERWRGVAGGTAHTVERAMGTGWLNEDVNEGAARDNRDQHSANDPTPFEAGRPQGVNGKVPVRRKPNLRQTKSQKNKR